MGQVENAVGPFGCKHTHKPSWFLPIARTLGAPNFTTNALDTRRRRTIILDLRNPSGGRSVSRLVLQSTHDSRGKANIRRTDARSHCDTMLWHVVVQGIRLTCWPCDACSLCPPVYLDQQTNARGARCGHSALCVPCAVRLLALSSFQNAHLNQPIKIAPHFTSV